MHPWIPLPLAFLAKKSKKAPMSYAKSAWEFDCLCASSGVQRNMGISSFLSATSKASCPVIREGNVGRVSLILLEPWQRNMNFHRQRYSV